MKFYLIVFLLLSNSVFSQINLTQGLMAYYTFNGSANDVSGNNNNPVFNNAILTADRFNNPNSAYRFNGINSFIQIPNSSTLNTGNAITLAVFINPTGFYYGTCHGNSILMKGSDITPATAYRLRFEDENYSNGTNCSYSIPDTIHQNYWGPGTGVAGGYTPYVTKNEWISLIYTYDGTYAKLYINCQLVVNKSSPGYNFSNANDLFIGKMNDPSFPYWLNGELDDIRIYNRAINEDEVKAIVGNCQVLQTPCNNWLKTTNPGDAVKIGDLDITGNKITVEASFNRTAAYTGGYLYGGDLVSKHADPTDCNYLLRPNNAEITTTNGFFQTPPVCEIELNKTYHAAMTYDGASLKFYRNGFLLKEVPASGNLVLNNWLTTIGDFAPGTPGVSENMNGFINEVRIWNVARTQADIKTYMNSSLPNPSTQTGLVAYYTFDNLLNKQGNTAWNGTLLGNASINATNSSCTFVADTCSLPPCPAKSDFSFKQNVCNPYQLTFSTTSTTYQSISWDFGDTNTGIGSSTISHTYASPGNYVVTMVLKYANCSDTVRKTFSVAIQNDNQTISTTDTTICLGSTKQLKAAPALSYCWSPSTYLDNPSVQNPVSTTQANITYYLTSEKKGTNLVVNGNFSAGNTGFTSDYLYSPSSGFNPGVYTVSSNPVAWHPQMPACTDHTGSAGNGNMMLVNGAEIVNVKVWTQTVAVQPNTNYAFETWLQHVTSVNPASLQFSINGVTIGPIFTANNNSCIWDKFYATWNSGNNTSATISIVNQNQIYTGNDFALDDISFAPIIISRDSVKITVDTPVINTSSDTAVCTGSSIQINTSGAASYQWSPAGGLSNTSISNPLASPSATTKYIVTGTNSFGCTAKDSITVTVNPKPIITLTNDTLICSGNSIQLTAGGGTGYNWLPVNTLSNPSIANPFATPTASTVYKVTVTNADNCSNTDSVRVDVRQPNTFSISPSTSVCSGDSVQLIATGGGIYSWSPASSLSNTNVANPLAYPVTSTDYDVTISDTLCNISETLSTTVAVNPLPALTVSKSNDVDCSNTSSQLNVAGGIHYAWMPAATLNNASIQNPIASPLTTTNYLVTGKDINGCSNTDSITVFVTAGNAGSYFMPNAFTPNNDGVNDCFGIKNWGPVTEFEFSIYNRWGERVFYTKDANTCWNGNFKATAQIPGVYSYMINAKNACGVIKKSGIVTLVR